jgi:rfaE bifunctional protein nucleotidyltransferase chain/domain/rfaE bifunctional protein kinase chain/domain
MTPRLVVLGDALLDVDVEGTAVRLSPDAPVPVLDDLVEYPRPGGAALAALLASRAGADVTLVTGLGDDENAGQLQDLLRQDGVTVIAVPTGTDTPVKRRVRAGGQCVVRLDSGGQPQIAGDLPPTARARMIEADAILVSDYGRGLTGVASVRDAVAEAAHHVPVVWDPHPRGAAPVAGVRVVTPNRDEARIWVDRLGANGQPGGTGLSVTAHHAATLVEAWRAGSVAVTMGDGGALLSYGRGTPVVLPPPEVAAGDPCGAGDQFAATVAVLLASDRVTEEAVHQAVTAAAHFVAGGGAAAVAGDKQHPETATSARSAGDVIADTRARDGVVVATGGCFDLLHAGHIACLQAARTLGDALIVCVNSDDSVRRLKGPGRPVVTVADRVRVLQALECVDAVEVFDDDTPEQVLRRLQPDVWAKGGDYAGADLPEAPVLKTWGGQAVALPYIPGRSTTAMVEAMSAPSTSRTTRRNR